MNIYDNIHGHIPIDPIAEKIINTPEFQRLRYIHQTGLLYLVFPTANHSRFEHSIGTYHLATKMITQLATSQPELGINKEIILLVGLAGLCHDLGHLLFSHLFDDLFLPNLPNYQELCKKTSFVTHEARSIGLLEYIVKKYDIELNKDQLKVIGDLINPKESKYSKWKPKYMIGKWIFQIVSNPLNSIDVDKFDYLTRDTRAVGLKMGFEYSRIIMDARVINDNICYSSHCNDDIYNMFFLRYRLHRQIYNHKVEKAIEIMVIDLLNLIEKELHISNYILEPELMIELVDSFVMSSTLAKTNKDIKLLLDNISMRKFPKIVFQDVSLIKKDIKSFETLLNSMNLADLKIIQFSAGYVGSKANPLKSIQFYSPKTMELIPENKIKNFSLLINQRHREYFTRIYCMNLEKYETIYDNVSKLLIDSKSKKQLDNSEETEEETVIVPQSINESPVVPPLIHEIFPPSISEILPPSISEISIVPPLIS